MLKGILAISGQPGLFKMVAEAKNNIIVESLETGKRMPVYSSSKVSALEDIAVFTDDGDVPLKDVLKVIYEKENGGNTISHKSPPDELKSYFAEALPSYDRSRVYMSDIKKVLLWYNILLKKELLDFTEKSEESEENESGEDEKKEQ
jgi:hypothetical protein